MHRISKRDQVLQGLDIIVIELIAGDPVLHVAFSSLDHFDFVDHKIDTPLQLSLFVVGFLELRNQIHVLLSDFLPLDSVVLLNIFL